MVSVKDIMTSEVTTLSPNDDLIHAERIMSRGRVRHLPVTLEGKLVGLVTHRDLLRAQVEALAKWVGGAETTSVSLRAGDRMMRNVMSATPETPIKEAARTMLGSKLGCLPVVSEGKLVGIVTESDFLRWALDDAR